MVGNLSPFQEIDKNCFNITKNAIIGNIEFHLYLCFVRLLAAILSIYFVSLSLFPCGDSTECVVSPDQVTVSMADEHQDHKHASELCAPFCHCACCSSPVFLHKTILTAGIFEISKDFTVFPEISYHPNNFHTIWQPPKIS